jgi:hypothetical protein
VGLRPLPRAACARRQLARSPTRLAGDLDLQLLDALRADPASNHFHIPLPHDGQEAV